MMRKLKPNLVLLSESDYWYNFLRYAKKNGATLSIVSGKLSERSTQRHQKLAFFSKHLFSLFDLVCAQNDLQRQRYERVGVSTQKIVVTGNIKFDAEYSLLPTIELESMRKRMGITSENKVVVIGSTHHPEEEQILPILEKIWKKYPRMKVLLAPRHPERSQEVEQLLQKHSIKYILFSQLTGAVKPQEAQVILMDLIGQLKTCYQLAHIAIVAGSYATHVGGHNILEPCGYGVPVLFGPYMHSQGELLDLVLAAKAGLQVPLEELENQMIDLLAHPDKREKLGKAGLQLIKENRGAAQRTWKAIDLALNKI